MTTDTMTLIAATAFEVNTARQALKAQLDGWNCAPLPDALLVFSELATNAVNHGGGATRIVVVHGDHTVHFDVHDHSHDAPSVRDSGGPAGGFGLRIVEQLSESWGWNQTVVGKVVWATVRCAEEPR